MLSRISQTVASASAALVSVTTGSTTQTSLPILDEPVLVDSPAAISTLVDALIGLPSDPPSLYIDIEGIDLGRDNGSISIIQIFVLDTKQTYLIDVHSLQGDAFSTPGRNHAQESLKTILESSAIPKVFFDVRADSANLFRQFSIHLGGIHDLQLMELVARPAGRFRDFITGLGKCIEYDVEMTEDERSHWSTVKLAGKDLFAPERGGRFEVFNERPLSDELIRYCAQDVQFLPRLWSRYNGQLPDEWKRRVLEESGVRVRTFFTASMEDDNGDRKRMVRPPEAWQNLEEFVSVRRPPRPARDPRARSSKPVEAVPS